MMIGCKTQLAKIGIGMGLIFHLSGCAFFATNQKPDQRIPIENPFADYNIENNSKQQNIVLRTKKGDRSVEIELPGTKGELTDFVMPVSPAFRDSGRGSRNPSSSEYYRSNSENDIATDDSYREAKPVIADREIASDLTRQSYKDVSRRNEVESELGVMQREDESPQRDMSYLGALDKVKQLYRMGRLEAALIEIDQLLPNFITDPRLHKMRGTILDRLGYAELAMKSWLQALRLNPSDRSLRKMLDRKRGLASDPGSDAAAPFPDSAPPTPTVPTVPTVPKPANNEVTP